MSFLLIPIWFKIMDIKFKNMKLITKIFTLALLVGLVSSCGDDEDVFGDSPLVDGKSVFFSFGNGTVFSEAPTLLSSATGASISSPGTHAVFIERSGLDVSEAVTVSFTASASFESTTDFFNAGDVAENAFELSSEGSVTIPAGQYSASFTLISSDDLLSSGNKVISLELTAVSDDSYSLGLRDEASSGKTMSVVIQDDDCPIDIEGAWAGTYSVSQTYNGGAFSGPILKVDLKVDPTDPLKLTALLNDIPGTGAATFTSEVSMEFNTCAMEVTMNSTFGVFGGGLLRMPYTLNSSFITVLGIQAAVYDESKFQITLTGRSHAFVSESSYAGAFSGETGFILTKD